MSLSTKGEIAHVAWQRALQLDAGAALLMGYGHFVTLPKVRMPALLSRRSLPSRKGCAWGLGRHAETERLQSLNLEAFPVSSVGRECSSEHRLLAYRLFFRRFILNDVPVLDKDSVLKAHNVGGNPIHGSTETA